MVSHGPQEPGGKNQWETILSETTQKKREKIEYSGKHSPTRPVSGEFWQWNYARRSERFLGILTTHEYNYHARENK